MKDSDSTLPSLFQLTEYMSYSIEMAFIDLRHKTICVFSDPFIARTGKELVIFPESILQTLGMVHTAECSL